MENLQQSRLDQKEMAQQLVKVLNLLITVESRIKTLEENKDKNAEVYEEFTQLKHEVTGAKKITRWLWVAITTVVGVVVSIKTELVELLNK